MIGFNLKADLMMSIILDILCPTASSRLDVLWNISKKQ